MEFGLAVRAARASRGWSRYQLELVIQARFRAEHFTLSDDAIKKIEYGACTPRETTRAILLKVFPELSTNKYQVESENPVVTMA